MIFFSVANEVLFYMVNIYTLKSMKPVIKIMSCTGTLCYITKVYSNKDPDIYVYRHVTMYTETAK